MKYPLHYKLISFRQSIQVPFAKFAVFRKSPLEYVRTHYQTPANQYTTMGVVCLPPISATITSSAYDLHEGISVQLQITALVYRPVKGEQVMVHLFKGRGGEVVGRIVDNHINSVVRLLDPPPHLDLCYNFIMPLTVESWQCQVMDKLVVIGRLVLQQPTAVGVLGMSPVIAVQSPQ